MKLTICFVLQLWPINKQVPCTPTKQAHYRACSLDGMQYFFIAYDYDTNYIFAKPISNLKDKTIIEAFESVFNESKDKGHKPTSNVIDNQCTKPIKAFLEKENCKWQFIKPTNHRVNAAERGIQT